MNMAHSNLSGTPYTGLAIPGDTGLSDGDTEAGAVNLPAAYPGDNNPRKERTRAYLEGREAPTPSALTHRR